MKKDWYKSKTIWGALAIALGAVGGLLTGQLDYVGFVTAMGNALGLLGILIRMRNPPRQRFTQDELHRIGVRGGFDVGNLGHGVLR